MADGVVGRITAILALDDKQFTAGLSGAESKFTSAHSTMVGKAKGITSAISGIASAMVAIGAVGFLKDSIQAAIDNQVALVRLQTAVNDTGKSWDDYSTSMEAAINSSIQLGYKDSDTTAALATLTTMTGDAGTALDALSLAQDLARAKGMDLAAASSLVAKVEEGRIGIAARVLPFLKSTMTVEEALAALREHTAGQAASYADTAAGAEDRWTASTDKLQESIGYALLPTLTGLVNLISPVVLGFAEMDDQSQAAVFAIGAVAAAGIAAATELSLAAAPIAAVALALLAVTKAAEGLGAAQANGGKGTTELSASMIAAGYHIDDLGNIINSAGQNVSDMKAQEGGLATAQTDLTIAVDGTITAWKEWQDEIDPVKSSNEAYLKDLVAVHAAQKNLTDTLKKHTQGTAEAKLAQDQLNDAARKAGVGAAQEAYDHGKAGDAAKKYADNLINAAVKSHDLTKKQGELAKQAVASARDVNGVTDAIKAIPKSTTANVFVHVDDSQFTHWLATFQSISKTLGLHVYGSGTPSKKGKAAGDIIAGGSGTDVTVAENGWPETLINWSPANKSRNAGLMATTASGIGLSAGGGSTIVFNNYASDVTGGSVVQQINAVMAGSTELAGYRAVMGAN